MEHVLRNENFIVEYIDTPELLDKCIQELETAKEMAFDLEFDRNKNSYGFNLCLIQVATAQKCFVIDPVAKIKPDALFRLFERPDILKVVHSPGEDLRLLHSLRCYPKNIFDIQIGARLLNYELISLGNLLDAVLGITADKKLQTSNWSKRPLTEEQVLYSSNDVIYLLRIKDEMIKQARAKNVLSFIEEECGFLETTIYDDESKENFLKEGERNSLSDYHQFVLNGLLKFRDSKAQKANKPAAWLIPNDMVREVAFGKLSIDTFLDWKGIYPGIKTPKFKAEFLNEFETLNRDAKDLSKKSKFNFLTDAEKRERTRMKEENEKIKEEKFKPIQQELERLYGTHTGKYILGEGVVGRILRKESRISDMKENYRKALIASIATGLNIDITDFI